MIPPTPAPRPDSPIRARIAPWIGLVALGAWLGWPDQTLLLVAAAASFAVSATGRAGRGRALVLAAGILTVALGFLQVWRVDRIQAEWEFLRSEREERIEARLADTFTGLLADGRTATERLALEAEDLVPTAEQVSRIRRSVRFDAAAVYDSTGTLRVWDGVHRGRVPDEVLAGGATWFYGEYALVRYLYVVVPIESGGIAMTARLLDTDFPPEVRRGLDDVAGDLSGRMGVDLSVIRPERARSSDGTIFDFGTPDQTLFSVRLERPGMSERLAQVDLRAGRTGTALVLLLWGALLLTAATDRERRLGGSLSLALLALVLPVAALPGLGSFRSPADVLLLGAPLARWVPAAGAVILILAVTPRPRWADQLLPGLGIAMVSIAAPVLSGAVSGATSSGFLADVTPGWIVLATVLALCVAGVVRVAMGLESPRPLPKSARRYPGRTWVVGLLVVVALGVMGTAVGAGLPGLPTWSLAIAGVPLLFWRGLPDGSLRREALTWALALALGSTVALTHLWGERIEARMALAETRMEKLGVEEDPYLDYLLRGMAQVADSLDAENLRPVELLYYTWRESGLPDASYPIHLTLWTENGLPREDLRIGAIPPDRPAVAGDAFRRAPGDSALVERYALEDAHYVLTVPLRDGGVLTGVVPPLRDLGRATLLGPLFESLDDRPGAPLTLVPLREGEPRDSDELTWIRTTEGWAGERSVVYPDAVYHAHYEVALPSIPVFTARATLLVGLHMLVGLLLVGGGLLLLGGTSASAMVPPMGPLISSFRTRITVALLAFFGFSILIFGSLAYRTIQGASQRAAELLAERAAAEASQVYFDVGGIIDFLAQRVGSEVLEYRDGSLREGSIEPLVELGLYEGWVPWEVHRDLSGREQLTALTTTRAGEWAYVTAYGLLPDGDVVGAPVPLSVGADALRAMEVRDLIAFAILVGGVLSFGLALLVGRALTRPIRTLRVASERVGAGNLSVRLHETRTDEFGAVFDAFNRMVSRLDRARRNLVRTSRRTRAIVDESATGVLAVDGRGIVTLANDRARSMLRVPLEEGSPMQAGAFGEVGHWLERYLREGPREAATEVQIGERRIRVRVRRIPEDEGPGGAVVNLEDVTDELRTERVLAWGEMARQVAHEVKNPLTPIKLSVQHLRRAWDDRRPDFDEILQRNAEAMLREIDRLAEIASSFSRLGAPEAAGGPLEDLALSEVVAEVLALYRGGQGLVHFHADVPSSLPPVRGRRSEVKEVLVNLLENARAAIEGAGEVRVTGEAGSDGTVLLRVMDDGDGIEEVLLSRVFEPHFSTRSTGTGLGLAIVRRLVDSWGGDVGLESRREEGTTVTIRFRTAESHPSGPPEPRTAS